MSRVKGFEAVGQAATVAEAPAAVRDLHPDLLLLDIFLPDGSGLDVLRRLSGDEGGDRPDAIMITADRDITSVRIAMKLGAVGYLVKPFGAPDLAERLTAYRELQHLWTPWVRSPRPTRLTWTLCSAPTGRRPCRASLRRATPRRRLPCCTRPARRARRSVGCGGRRTHRRGAATGRDRAGGGRRRRTARRPGRADGAARPSPGRQAVGRQSDGSRRPSSMAAEGTGRNAAMREP
ncbi:response regulator [Streptomyces sp. NPDC019531]|uniref:response regulator n=1 Tax=Streptomyces sp. NPDC019531 TaxID=3365062 RepID=UPI003850F57A